MLEKSGTRKDPSRVVIVGSTAGLGVTMTGENSTIMYAVSKAAAHHLAANLAVELGPRNITTNTIIPGYFPSKLANGIIDILGGQALYDDNPRRRLGEPDDIAGAMVYLCSPAGAYANGVQIVLDGGHHHRTHYKL
jgi:NAD(P)-dependent dehydrogenase (short-subunit alcohol dehydrogenase family)